MRIDTSRTVIAALAIGASAVAATTAGAQVMEPTRAPIYFGIAAGATIPTGSTSDLHGTGWHVQGLVDWMSPVAPIGLRGDLGFTSLGGKEISAGNTSIRADDLHMWAGTADAVWMFRPATGTSVMTPYALGGVGLYHSSGGRSATTSLGTTQTTDDSSWNFGLNFGGGVMFDLSGFSTFAEARFHNVFNAGRNGQGEKASAHFIPITFGVRFGGR
ncbi:MAG TPA: hypothetical protein VFS44_06690 [Gemmatimonadaceae bacterium]|nr:hypothetical protein [Gemmatimonadaceae bacterium]